MNKLIILVTLSLLAPQYGICKKKKKDKKPKKDKKVKIVPTNPSKPSPSPINKREVYYDSLKNSLSRSAVLSNSNIFQIKCPYTYCREEDIEYSLNYQIKF